MALLARWTTSMTPQDKVFYQRLGQRIAQWRKAQHLTQQQLAEKLGIAQQTLAHYETGRLRIAVATLPPLAQVLGVSVEALLDEHAPNGRRQRGPLSKLQQQIEQVRQLPRARQQFVMELLETVIQQPSSR